MLEVKDLHVNYGAVHALNGISLHVDDGEIVSLIGANGAGKTTTLRTITGLEKAASGSVMFDGHDLRKAEPSKIITYKLAHNIALCGGEFLCLRAFVEYYGTGIPSRFRLSEFYC